MKLWDTVKDQFEVDGSLRDIYISNISLAEWDQFISEMRRSNYRISFTHGEEILELPSTMHEIRLLQKSNPTTLKVYLEKEVQVNCHFFTDEEIELDIDPTEIQSEESYLSVTNFMNWLSRTMKRSASLTHENSPEMVIATAGNNDA